MAGLIKHDGTSVSGRGKQSNEAGINNLSGIYVGEVIDNSDSLYTGRITVRISEFGAKSSERICLLAIPFGGHTKIQDSGKDPKKESQAPVSYGMWPQPPEIGTNVVIAYTGSIQQGIVMGSLIAKDRNAMMGGRASGQVYANNETSLGTAVEKNPKDTNDADTKPLDEYFQSVLNRQGLSLDYVRGHSQSSARRESPSKVFGITTRQGHVLSMDDGDEQNSSNNIRLRTKSGAQILMDDSNGFVFITNQSGDAWVEMDFAGHIDVYSKAGISMHTEGDYNVHAKGSINMQAEIGVNIKSSGGDGIKLETTKGAIDVYSALDMNLESATNYNLLVAGNQIIKGTRIDMNGAKAPEPATKTPIQNQTSNDNVKTSVASRVPEKHPWKGVSSVEETFSSGKGNII
tara:strand:- start:1952 stop:3160 length:1209 start_codon:yes stop_codon:yes gene_type:complete